ncbi:AfsR/SARP family transcriptional regulator [Streptomyces poonensis]|uniref:OmpR/PhoB-type domain-containing protein n=1 Tax=Streptomyces poonensis TaxID=68255 RepID=A0A918UG83_9ACTN|nr:hypothetical protein GCM10010365_23130 [Streptomyces poonensis]GLJ90752.1 hypothetical protein GCM10017589_33570 [Streptomyces poonensis]
MDDHTASPKLRFAVLGPLRVWRNGAELNAGPVQQRVVLAVLLLHANRPVPREKLIDAVWGQAAPGRAVNLLQRHAAGLRRVLEPGRPARAPSRLLVWSEAGYTLTVPAGALDLETFTAQVQRGRAARAGGDLPAAAEALHRALDMLRGRLCEGLAAPLLDAERDRFERPACDHFIRPGQRRRQACTHMARRIVMSCKEPHSTAMAPMGTRPNEPAYRCSTWYSTQVASFDQPWRCVLRHRPGLRSSCGCLGARSRFRCWAMSWFAFPLPPTTTACILTAVDCFAFAEIRMSSPAAIDLLSPAERPAEGGRR